jgi:hypothetical protein
MAGPRGHPARPCATAAGGRQSPEHTVHPRFRSHAIVQRATEGNAMLLAIACAVIATIVSTQLVRDHLARQR